MIPRAPAAARRAPPPGCSRRSGEGRSRTSGRRLPEPAAPPLLRPREAPRLRPRRRAAPSSSTWCARAATGAPRSASAAALRSCAPSRQPPGVDSYTARRTSGWRNRKRRGTSVGRTRSTASSSSRASIASRSSVAAAAAASSGSKGSPATAAPWTTRRAHSLSSCLAPGRARPRRLAGPGPRPARPFQRPPTIVPPSRRRPRTSCSR